MSSPSEITTLLVDWSNGDRTALDKLFPLVERELHKIAHRQMRREEPGHTLQTTALINETYLRLVDQNRIHWKNRTQFYGIASIIMRRFLRNYARDKKRNKRGGGAAQISLSGVAVMSQEKSKEILALDEALDILAVQHERKSRVVELRYYGGLSFAEIAELLDVSKVTVERDWSYARAWLLRELS
ncbi:MAG TPA: sigma-70 family RNA polymerase sigma factor [Pyrinomonadaceae bacterium]|nr:sigma-70 family RNA polymerase sigma factor [Pyrinomonadaceae bacterium]